MNGFCDWCEEPATMKRTHLGREHDICDACDEKEESRAGAEWEANMSQRERDGWRRARDAGVD